mmetsp:Transcript_28480/g.42247  ORF Transcript_28480/g.42247 Transcript_28480/m.42247 type:complete len:157 (+) Transcript_28480:78-548(+)
MKITIFFKMLIALFVTSVEGFAPLSTVANKQCGRTNTNVNAAAPAAGPLSASQDSNQGDSEDAEYDFEAGFQERLKKEGGRTGIKVKAAKRSVDSVTRDVTGSVQTKIDLLSASEWNLTVGFLALVVVLAVGTHFASPPQPFETSTNGEQLGFGVR